MGLIYAKKLRESRADDTMKTFSTSRKFLYAILHFAPFMRMITIYFTSHAISREIFRRDFHDMTLDVTSR